MDTNFWRWALFSFNGRITRMYYWLVFLLFMVVEVIIFGVLVGISALVSGDIAAMSPLVALFSLPLSIAAIWIGLAVSIKRWHDRGKSGWWILVGLIPFIGGFWTLIECGFLPGTDGVNQYGMENTPPTEGVSSATTASAVPPAASVSNFAAQTGQGGTAPRRDNPYAP